MAGSALTTLEWAVLTAAAGQVTARDIPIAVAAKAVARAAVRQDGA